MFIYITVGKAFYRFVYQDFTQLTLCERPISVWDLNNLFKKHLLEVKTSNGWRRTLNIKESNSYGLMFFEYEEFLNHCKGIAKDVGFAHFYAHCKHLVKPSDWNLFKQKEVQEIL